MENSFRKTKGKHGYEITEIILPDGEVRRKYFYKRKQAYRVFLKTRLSNRLTGYALIEKDIRNIKSWLRYIDDLFGDGRKEGIIIASNREKFNIIKGLYIAFLASYGKCFTNCKGRNAKLEKVNLEEQYYHLHDELMRQRHNYVAHSGDDKVETADIALVFPQQRNALDRMNLFTELSQPDYMGKFHDMELLGLVEHIHRIVEKKINELTNKIMNEEVFTEMPEYWVKKGKTSLG